MNILPEQVAVQRGVNLIADTTAETKTAVVDMEGYDEVTFAVDLGDVDAAAVMTFTVKENTANATTGSPTAITLTGQTGLGAISNGALVITEDTGNLDNKTILITVAKSAFSKRYCFLSITAATESYEVNAITILKTRAREVPVSQPSNVVATAKAVC